MAAESDVEKRRAYQRAWYHRHRSARLAANKAYREKNADRITAQWKERYYRDLVKSRAKSRSSRLRHESMQHFRPVAIDDPRSLVGLQRRLGGASRGALSKSADMGGANHARREQIVLHAMVTAQTHDEWLEQIDLWRLAERLEREA